MDNPQTIALKNLRNPRHTSNGMITLDCTLINVDGVEEETSFCACANDTADHGREIFKRAMAGEFGAITDYVAPPDLPKVQSPIAKMQDDLDKLKAALVAAKIEIPQ